MSPSIHPRCSKSTRIAVLGAVLGLIGTMLAWAAPPVSATAASSSDLPIRVAGRDRFETAARLADVFSPSTTDTVFVANGHGFADAYSAGPAAAAAHAPLLLVERGSVPPATANAISRLDPDRIVVVGGDGAVSPAARAALASHAPVTVLAGSDRWDTAQQVVSAQFPAAVPEIVIVSGRSFADGLTGGHVAATTGSPVVPVDTDFIPAAVDRLLGSMTAGTVRIIGGSTAVSSNVERQLRARFPNVVRHAGADRFATAGAAVAAVHPNGAERALAVTGYFFADALATIPAAHATGRAMLLSGPGCGFVAMDAAAMRLATEEITFVGGPAAIPEDLSSVTSCGTAPADRGDTHSDDAPDVPVERRDGVGGALCSGADPARVSASGVPVEVCIGTDGVIKVMNRAAYWVSVTPISGAVLQRRSRYSGPSGEIRSADLTYAAAARSPFGHLPPNAVVDYEIAAPYTGDVVFGVEVLRSASLAATVTSFLPNAPALVVEIVDVARNLIACMDAKDGWQEKLCTVEYAGNVVFAVGRYATNEAIDAWSKAKGKTGLYGLALDLAEANYSLIKYIDDALRNFPNNTFRVAGTGGTTSPGAPPAIPPTAAESGGGWSGELHEGGLTACAATYPGHPKVGSSWSASVDVNVVGGDYDRPLYMPWDGTVSTHTTGYGGGWGNSVILTRASDGYKLFIAHNNAILANGPVQAGTMILRSGNTGHVEGTSDHGGAHLHLNAQKDGQPAPIVLGGTVVEPGVCWKTRTSPTGTTPGAAPAAPSGSSVTLRDGGTYNGSSLWYDVTLSKMAPNTAYVVTCSDAEDRAFYREAIHTDSAGNGRDSKTCYSNVGGRYVTVAGVDVAWGTTAAVGGPSSAPTTPQPAGWSILVTRGGAAPAGHWYDTVVRGPAGGSTTLWCNDGVDQRFWTQAVTLDANGYYRDSTLCYSGDPGPYYVTSAVGARSNDATW